MSLQTFTRLIFAVLLFAGFLLPCRPGLAEQQGKNSVRAHRVGKASSSPDMNELSSRFAFLSDRLAHIPELPKIERLDEMAEPPRMQEGVISFGVNEKRKAVD